MANVIASETRQFVLPGDTERAVVLGRTGSGKSIFLTWLLSHASIDARPWIIIDHKNDDYLKSLPRIRPLRLGDGLPKHAGLYIIQPKFSDDDLVDEYLHKVLAKGNIGLFTDEGGKIPQQEPRYLGLKSVFAQGRSKHVPILFATQRPAWINKSVLSEGDYYAVFHLQNADDIARATKVIPKEIADRRLDEYHCHWYDVRQNASFVVKPVDPEDILERLDMRLKPRVRMI